MSSRKQKLMTQPISQIFRLLQNQARVQIWLYENKNMRMEGVIIGFDEYMNLVLESAAEVDARDNSRQDLGRVLLKGDNISVIQQAPQNE